MAWYAATTTTTPRLYYLTRHMLRTIQMDEGVDIAASDIGIVLGYML